jgi:hypothetical protein
MKKINFVLLLLIAAAIGFGGCSKKDNAEKIIGKWKAENLEQMPGDSAMTIEIFYEFTKDKLIAEGSAHGQPFPKLEIPYTVKSQVDTVILEATHPQSGAKGEFKITFEGDKLKMIDPDGAPYTLVKRD